MRDVLVLCYHAVSEKWRSDISVTPRQLEQQLRLLVRRGYRGARFHDAIAGAPVGKNLVVTFDDAYRSVLALALPILGSLDLPGTVFAPTGFAAGDQFASWPGMEPYAHGRRAGELAVMSWKELASLSASGWEIGSHTHTHPHLPELDDDELLEELAGSRRECEATLGTPCLSLAYPYGDTDTRVMAAASRAGYRAAAGLPARRFHAPLALNWPRVGVYGSDRRWRFELKTSPAVRRLRTVATPNAGYASPERVTPRVPTGPVAGDGARIAVIVPCFNDGELVVQAVNSIDEPEPVEIVVVDDASTERSTLAALDRLRRSGVRVVRHDRNRGLPAARMTGLHATTAGYVFPLDADDLAVPGALGAMADRLDDVPGAAVCFGDYAEFGTRNRIRRVPARLDPYRVAYRNDYPVSSLFRRSVLESVGGWQAVGDEVGYEDWNLWMTLAERGATGVHRGPEVTVRRRLHGRRMLSDAAKRHVALYATLRTLHPQLFAELRSNRRTTDLSLSGRWLYPLVFGWRPPLSMWTRALQAVAKLREWVRGGR